MLTKKISQVNVRNKDMKKVCLNVYDIRMKDEPYPECGLSWPYELADVTRYLRVSATVSQMKA